MKNVFKLPDIVSEAKEKQQGKNIFVELLIFVAVFFVIEVVQSLVLIPGVRYLTTLHPDYAAAAQSQDPALIAKISSDLMASNEYLIMFLFSNAILILLTILFCKFFQKRNVRTLGFVKKNFVKEYLLGLLIGFVIFSSAVLIGLITGSLEISSSISNCSIGFLVLFFLGYMIQGMAEEVFCRGYLLVSIARRYSLVLAILLNSIFFAMGHLGNDGITPLSVVNLTLCGIFFSLYFVKRGNIWGVGAIHTIWNFVQGNFYGIKVSGMACSCSVLQTTIDTNKTIINGGDFGLEGGLAVTIVLIVGIVILYIRTPKEETNKAEN